MAKDFEYTVTGKFTKDLRGVVFDFGDHLVRLFAAFAETPLEIIIKPFYKQRSLAQNRWIWGVAVVTVRAFLKETTGECPSKDAVYIFFRVKVLGHEPVVEIVQGEEIIVLKGKHLSQMTTVEFSEASEKIINYYKPLGCIIEFPKDNNTITDFIIAKDKLKDE